MKFTSIFTALLFASAQSAAVRDVDEHRKLGLGSKSSRRMEEEVAAAFPGGGGGGKSRSCAAENPVIAVEQVLLAALTTKAILKITEGIALYLLGIPSLVYMIDNADFFACKPKNLVAGGYIKPLSLGRCINKIYAEMSCEEYNVQKETSILIADVLPNLESEVDLLNVNGVTDPEQLTLDDLNHPETEAEGDTGLLEYITSAAAAEAEASEAEADGDSV